MNQLALHGGTPAKTTPYTKGKRFDGNELRYLQEALEQNTLFYWQGKLVKRFTAAFAALCGAKHCVAASSGTAGIHVALGACGVTAGDEVITAPITDMGTVIGILYQNAVPVFADVCPDTHNMDPADIERKITDKTKAILVVHLAGHAADMDSIMAVAQRHGLRVIEDCAQSYMCYYKGKMVGTIGDVGCFSLNDFKHISAGDGGMIVTNDDALYARAMLFADKGYNRLEGRTVLRSVEALCPNYRMTELQGAVGLAQLERLAWICERRRQYGEALSAALSQLPGIQPIRVLDDCVSSYWFYTFRVDEAAAGVSRDAFAEALSAEGVPNQRGYIPACVYEYDVFTNQNAYPGSHCPFDCALNGNKHEYAKGLCPTAEAVLAATIYLSVNEFFSDADLAETIEAVRKVSAYYAAQR